MLVDVEAVSTSLRVGFLRLEDSIDFSLTGRWSGVGRVAGGIQVLLRLVNRSSPVPNGVQLAACRVLASLCRGSDCAGR